MTKVAVTGASGHIGANLVRELLARGYQVTALVRQTSHALEGLDVLKAHGDLSDLQSLCSAFRGVDQVYHLAAFISMQSSDSEQLEKVNVEGTRHVIEACQSEGVAILVHFSSIHALNPKSMHQEMTEDSPLLDTRSGRKSDYEHSKAKADRLVRQNCCSNLSTRIIYPTAVLGPNDFNRSLFGQAILKMAHGRLPALVAGGFDWVDVRDVARGAIEVAEKGKDKDRFILSGHFLSTLEVAEVIAELTGIAAPRFTCPTWLAGWLAPVMLIWARLHGETPVYTRGSLKALSTNKFISHARATNLFAYQSRPFRQSMQDALDFYSGHNQT